MTEQTNRVTRWEVYSNDGQYRTTCATEPGAKACAEDCKRERGTVNVYAIREDGERMEIRAEDLSDYNY